MPTREVCEFCVIFIYLLFIHSMLNLSCLVSPVHCYLYCIFLLLALLVIVIVCVGGGLVVVVIFFLNII